MAFKLPAIFTRTDAKSRVLLVLGAVGLVIGLIVFGSRYLSGNTNTTGQAKIANAPSSLQSVPGGQLSPEYYRALQQANSQASKQAQISGTSAVPTLMNNTGQEQETGGGNCTVLCPGTENPDVANDINDLVKQGKLSKADANTLLALAKNNASVTDYEAALNEMVRQGKLTPEQARKLLETYKKQHANMAISQSARNMDALIKSGKLPLDVANSLLALQKQNLTPAQYADELNRLVREGKISPAVAAQLLAEYTQAQAKRMAEESASQLKILAKQGQISPDVAQTLAGLQGTNAPYDQYKATLDKLVAEGKMTPAMAAKLASQYQYQRAQMGPALTLDSLLPQDSPEKQKLLALQANNASVADYAAELKRAVLAGTITPEMASKLLQQYQAMVAPITNAAGSDTNLPGGEAQAKLQQRLQEQQSQGATQVVADDGSQFAQAQAQARAQAESDAARARLQRIQDLMTGMSTQAQSLVAAWQPSSMQHKAGQEDSKKSLATSATDSLKDTLGVKKGANGKSDASLGPTSPPLIKAGTILFAVLETAVDSDYPDTPVMATIVQGKFKGAKLLGKLNLTKDQDRVSLVFNLLDKDDWLATKPVNAFAMDPDTARTVLASNVNYHYMLRYGSMFASSFVSGYASAIQSSGGSSVQSAFGTSTQNPALSPASKLAVGLGQVGTTMGSAMSSYFNTPPTVKVNAGVGLGIIFMADVPSESQPVQNSSVQNS